MIVEQFLKDVQNMIDNGILNPSAEIEILGLDSIIKKFEIGIQETQYNKLLLFESSKED